MTVRNVTLGAIHAASKVDDIDDAIAPLQAVAGITDGGVASIAFSGFDWTGATPTKRLGEIVRWLMLERHYEEMQP
jgi:hypothetical protein